MHLLRLLLSLWPVLLYTNAARILVVAPTYAISHFKMIQPLLQRLLDNHHHLTVVSSYPNNHHHPNYTDVDLRPVLEPYILSFEQWGLWNDVYDMYTQGLDGCDTLLGSAPVQELLNSHKQFDLVLVEAFACEAVLGFPMYYNAPYIGFSPMALPPWLADWAWNPVESSSVPDHMCREAGTDLASRSYRWGCQTLIRVANWWFNTRTSIQLIKKHFGVGVDSLTDIKANMSAMFVNTMPALGGVRAYLPNVVEIGGIHLGSVKKLPPELSEWLDGCTSGAIVFSMGSMVKGATLADDVRQALLDIFKRLGDMCVLWKWEDKLDDLPANVRIVTWLPQADVLAHENVRVFIAHGGFHGLLEAIYRGVPVLGIPLYGDQMTNLEMLEQEGAAAVVNLAPFDAQLFQTKLLELLRDDSYKSNMARLSLVAQDVPRSPLETAEWWTEHVIRHRGASHLRHRGALLPWYQYYMLDVITLSIALLWLVLRLSIHFLSIF